MVAPTPPAVRAAELVATPNPVPEGSDPGTTVIRWDTGDGAPGEVFVSEEGGAERLFVAGAAGEAEASWIWPGTGYRFLLYRAGRVGAPLAAIEVRKKHGMGHQRLDGVDATLAADAREDERLRLLLALTLTSTSSCIDVGGNEGRILSQMVRYAPLGRHICYEPLPDHHADLARRFPGVDVRRKALSNREGVSSFVYVTTHSGFSGFRERTYPGPESLQTLEVSTERLDAALRPDDRPALIKIDVEGAEQEVLEGARETLRRHNPVVVFEHGRGAADHYATRPERIFELICDGTRLRIFDLDGNGPYTVEDFTQTFDAGARWNFVARPW